MKIKPDYAGRRLRTFGILALLVAGFFCPPVMADAIKCKQSNGKIVISNIACAANASAVSVQRSEYISASQRQVAINDVERQRQFLNSLDRERQTVNVQVASSRNVHQGSGDAYDPETRDRIHACLMKITATSGLSSVEEARRKVNCYRNTRNLASECESRITATGGLMTDQERYFKGLCRLL